MAATLDAPTLSATTIARGSTLTISSTLHGDATGVSGGVTVETFVTSPLGITMLDTTNPFATVSANSATPFTVTFPVTTAMPVGQYSVTQGIRAAPENITVVTPSGVTAGLPVTLHGTFGYTLASSSLTPFSVT